MKQLYLLGTVLAIVVLVLLGLNKLEPAPGGSTPADIEPDTTLEAEQTTIIETDNVTQEPMQTFESNTFITMKTNYGDIRVELFTKDMPITAGNFLKLSEEGFYTGIKFHRVINGFMIQGGDPLTKDEGMKDRWGTGGPGYAIEDEFVPGFSNVRGTLSMANSGPNSGGSQFFINLVDNVNLDFDKQPLTSQHPVFGRVVSGLEVVDTIGGVETGVRDVPVAPVVIEEIHVDA